jgi:hypothetical protein
MPPATGLSHSLTNALTADNDRRSHYAHRQAAKKQAQRHRNASIQSSSALMYSIEDASRTARSGEGDARSGAAWPEDGW